MKKLWIALAALSFASCAHLGIRGADTEARAGLWHEAHIALYQEDFPRADSLFNRLAAAHPHAEEGREALFYVGAIHIDPRNQAWDSERAETVLRRYLQQDTIGTLIHRRPEATTLLEIARQLNLPAEDRVEWLQPGTITRTEVIERPPRRIAPTDQLREVEQENDRLRQQLAQRDAQIRRQQDELDRIRRTLTPRGTP
jgi:hypothetical protein